MNAPAFASTSVEGKRRKRNLVPKPLPATRTPKNRIQARSVGKCAKVFETVDLLSQQANNINILQDITFKPNHHLHSETTEQQLQVAATSGSVQDDILEFPLTQNVINTVFEGNETDNAIEALMASLDASVGNQRPMSPDIFHEADDFYKTDTIEFIDEKIALLKTKISIKTEDFENFKIEESALQKKLDECRQMQKKTESDLHELNHNLTKFEAFRDVLL